MRDVWSWSFNDTKRPTSNVHCTHLTLQKQPHNVPLRGDVRNARCDERQNSLDVKRLTFDVKLVRRDTPKFSDSLLHLTKST